MHIFKRICYKFGITKAKKNKRSFVYLYKTPLIKQVR